ncbi:MAG: hypothetical protein ACRD3W_11905, partial [Terriglobales bacterium]
LVLRGLIEGLRIELEVIEYYNPQSRPLARLLAESMELPCDSYRGPDRPDRALLVMASAADIIGPHDAFIETSDQRIIFAYGLPVREPLPLVPDIVGCMIDPCTMPWDEKARGANLDKLIASMLDKTRHLELDTEILRQVQDAVEYYDAKRELLLCGNNDKFPERPEYTAEIPQ